MKTLMACPNTGEDLIPLSLDGSAIRPELMVQPRGLDHLLTQGDGRPQRHTQTQRDQTKINTYPHQSLIQFRSWSNGIRLGRKR